MMNDITSTIDNILKPFAPEELEFYLSPSSRIPNSLTIEAPYEHEANASEGQIQSIFGVYDIWIIISEYVGLLEMYATGRTNRMFNEMTKLLRENETMWTQINQAFWSKTLIGDVIENSKGDEIFGVLDIDIKARCILIDAPHWKGKRYQCIRFASDAKPKESFYQGHYTDKITERCAYCGFGCDLNYPCTLHLEDCGWGRKYWQDKNEEQICKQMKIFKDQVSGAERLKLRDPSILCDFSLQDLKVIKDFRIQKCIPKTNFMYQCSLLISSLVPWRTHDEKTIFWADLDRIFNLDDHNARTGFMRMKNIKRNRSDLKVSELVGILEGVRDLMDEPVLEQRPTKKQRHC